MKKHIHRTIARIALVIGLTLVGFVPPCIGQRVVGYTTSWTYNANQIDYGSLTHINYSFALPTASGGLEPVENPSKLQSVVSQAHARGVKVLIAVGGWDIGDGGGNDRRFETLAATAAGRTNFVNSVIRFIEQYNLDGADIDWEYPDPTASGAPDPNYTALMQQLSTALHRRGWLLTAAVVATSWAGNGISNEVFPSVDWLNIMAYDGGNGAAHSPYSYAVAGLDYWLGRGLPKSKAVLGVPFYARPSWNAYRTLLAQGADPYGDVFNGDYYNGINTIKAKTRLAQQRASGIMIWTIDQDVQSQYSLLRAIAEETGSTGGGGGGGNNTATQLEAENYSNMSGVQTEACSEGGQNVGWIDQGDWMAFYNVSFPTSGRYTIEYRVASPNGSQLSADLNAGSIQLGAVTIPATGGWQNWTTVSHTVSVNAGTYNFGVFAPAGGWNLNWVRIRSANAAARTHDGFERQKDQTTTEEFVISPELKVYPNPASSTLTVDLPKEAKEGRVQIINMAGKVVLEERLHDKMLNISLLPSGMYQLQVRTSDGLRTQKFIKQ